MSAPIRWGLMATGGIARTFAQDLRSLPDCEIVAVGSRSRSSADAFAPDLSIARRHGSYADLVADPDVDVVYVSPPHPVHRDATLLAIEHGKAVLCEKPFAMDRRESQQMVDAARSASVFLMEAMWTRFLPHVARLRQILAAGTLGDLVYLTAEHGQWFPQDASHRLFAPSLGGGALLDLGVYPVSFAHLVLGPPSSVTAVSTPAFTGVDATTSMILRYPSGAHAVLTTSLAAKSNNPAVIHGTEARLEIDGWFYTPTSMRVVSRDERVLESFSTPPGGRGMEFEAAEVNRCLRAGLTESPLMPLGETLDIMGVLDEIRAQIGLDHTAL
ncbi:MAG: Gfo/Idh/MocA family oxidoreductase [Actinomycetota bacterium]|nr:Gfo/Idh/MocA family oxidoreductase [Actinomycetota bacterium]